MIDRASILWDPEIVELFSRHFVPVAVDQHIHRRLRNAEGAFFARVLAQAGKRLDGAAQGFYGFTAKGRLLAFRHTLSVSEVKRLLGATLERFDPKSDTDVIPETLSPESRPFDPPLKGLVVNVTTRVMQGDGMLGADREHPVRHCVGRDHLWILKDEADSLTQGRLPVSVARRLARFHLIDNTRGEPPMWKEEEIRKLQIELRRGRLSGSVHLQTACGDRSYEARLFGFVEAKRGRVVRFDVLANGRCWGEGIYNPGAPPGRFPLLVGFTLADLASAADRVPPGGARRSLHDYLHGSISW